MLLAAPASIGVVLAWRNPRAGVGMVLLGTVAITLAPLEDDGLPFPWTVPSMLALLRDAPIPAAGVTPVLRAVAPRW